jgi:hypothetical protein
MTKVDESGFRRHVIYKQSSGAFTPTNGVETLFSVFEVNATRSHDMTGTLLISATLGSALAKANDKLYAYHLDSKTGLYYPVRDVWSDAAPANLWEAADGLTTVKLSVPVRLAPYMAFGITMVTGKAITPTEDWTFRFA